MEYYILITLLVLLAAYFTWMLAKMDASLFEIETRVIACTIVLASINNMLYEERTREKEAEDAPAVH